MVLIGCAGRVDCVQQDISLVDSGAGEDLGEIDRSVHWKGRYSCRVYLSGSAHQAIGLVVASRSPRWLRWNRWSSAGEMVG